MERLERILIRGTPATLYTPVKRRGRSGCRHFSVEPGWGRRDTSTRSYWTGVERAEVLTRLHVGVWMSAIR